MKKIFTIITLMLCMKLGFSQNSNLDKHNQQSKQVLKDAYTKAPYIFEGKIIHGEDYYNKAHTGIYTKYTIKVSKALKGTITDSLVELITYDEDYNITRYDQLNELRKNIDWNFNGVFYGFNTKFELDEKFDKSKLYISEYGSIFIPFNTDVRKNTGYVANFRALNFESYSELYEILGFHQLSEAQLKLEKNNEAGSITQKEYDEYLKIKELNKKKQA